MPNTHRPGIGILLSLAAQPSTAFAYPDYEVRHCPSPAPVLK